MSRGFGYYDNVAGVDYNDPYNDYNRRRNYPTNNWTNLAAGAGLGLLLGFGPLVGLGFGALLSDRGGQNTNIININTDSRRRCY